MPSIGYLGPIGSFTHLALQRYLEKQSDANFESESRSNFFELFDGLESGDFSHIIVPIENSLGGEVNASLDGLLHLSDAFYISDEVFLPIQQSLLAKKNM